MTARHWLDDVARGVAAGESRRSVLKKIAAGAVGVMLGSVIPSEVSASHKPNHPPTESCRGRACNASTTCCPGYQCVGGTCQILCAGGSGRRCPSGTQCCGTGQTAVCCSGCCKDGLCITSLTDVACGTGGKTCANCTASGEVCNPATGTCVAQSCTLYEPCGICTPGYPNQCEKYLTVEGTCACLCGGGSGPCTSSAECQERYPSSDGRKAVCIPSGQCGFPCQYPY